MMKIVLILILLLFEHKCLLANTYEDTSKAILKEKLLAIIQKTDSCGLKYVHSMPSGVWDSVGNFLETRIYVVVYGKEIEDFKENLPKVNYTDFNDILFDILKDSICHKCSWSANLLLFDFNGLSAPLLFPYKNCDWGAWIYGDRRKYIDFWNERKSLLRE